MRFREIERIVIDAVEAMVAAGVSRPAAEKAMEDAEIVAVMDLIETQADRRLLDLFATVGSQALAQREGVTTKTICNRRRDAVDRLYRKQIGSGIAARDSSEAA